MSLAVINTWSGSDVGGYGPTRVGVANSLGNALIAFVAVGSDSQFSGAAGYCPRATVSDDAHNLWQFAGSNFVAWPGQNRRVDVWVCPNANAANIVNVSSNIVYAGMAVQVIEVTGFPAFAVVDFAIGQNSSGTSATVSGTANTSDFVLGACFFFGFVPGSGSVVSPTGAATTTWVGNIASAGDMSEISGNAFYFANPVAAGAVSYTETWTTVGAWTMVAVGFKAAPNVPISQPNVNFPGLKVESAFGWQPGSVSGAMPTWTDLTSRAIGEDGTTIMSLSRGRDYELAQPEAGQLELSLNNQDGAFNPTNIPYGLSFTTPGPGGQIVSNPGGIAASPGNLYSGGMYVWANQPWPAGAQFGIAFAKADGSWTGTSLYSNPVPLTTTPQVIWVSNATAPALTTSLFFVVAIDGSPPPGFQVYIQEGAPYQGGSGFSSWGGSPALQPSSVWTAQAPATITSYGTMAVPPFWPNVVPEVPVRVSALWNARQYGLGYFYANKWTQDFPHPQWGFETLEASDVIGMASQQILPSAYAGQVLADFAQSYWTLGEYYTAPHGFLFSNLSRGSQKPMVGYSPSGFSNTQSLQTGLSLGLAGDPATGIGLTNFSASGFNALEGGGGALVRDNSFPSLANGVSFEFWTGPITSSSANVQILTALGMPGNFIGGGTQQNGARLGVYAAWVSGSPNKVQWQAILQDPTGNEIINTFPNGTTTPGALLNHVVVTVNKVGTTWTVVIWVNGVQVTLATGTSSMVMDWRELVAGPVIPTGGTAIAANYVIGQVAVYPWVLPAKRITEHWGIGQFAAVNNQLGWRLGRLAQWAAFSSLPVGSYWDPPSPLLGNADQIQGTALADALYAMTISEGGMFYAPATLNGEIWYQTRVGLYNQASTATFGDNPVYVNNANPGMLNDAAGWGTTAANFYQFTDPDTGAPGGSSAWMSSTGGGPTQFYARYGGPATGNASYQVNGYLFGPGVTYASCGLSIDWFTADPAHGGTYITTSASQPGLPNANVWTPFFLKATAPANAGWMFWGPTVQGSAANLNIGFADMWLSCTSSEIPYDAGLGFDYSDQFLFNIVSSQRTINTGTQLTGATDSKGNPTGPQGKTQVNSSGADAIAADVPSQNQYMSRGPLQQDIETTSDQDAYDRANWSLAKYKQPMLRANQIKVHCASNPQAFATMLGIEQGDIVTVNRRPIGAPVISLQCIVQKVEHQVGPNMWDVTLTLAPYFPENAVLQLDNGPFNQLGYGSLAW